MRTLKEIWDFARSPRVVIPPSPDQLAVAFASALIMSGKYDNAGAAISQAWWVVPEFYRGRQEYQEKIAPMYFGGVLASDADPGAEYDVASGHDAEPPNL